MRRAGGEGMSWDCCVASEADVVWAVGFEVGTTAAGVTGKDSGTGVTTGGASNWGWDGCW